MSSVEELRVLARNEDANIAYDAIEQLGRLGADDPETISLLVDAVASDASFESMFSDPWARVPIHYVFEAAVAAIKAIGGNAIDAVIERIATPKQPGDALLLERAASLGRPLFDIARILVTDGELSRARAAEAIVADFVHDLAADEAVGIYLAVAERDRESRLLSALWPRFRAADVKAAIAARWVDRGLRDWIELRLDRNPRTASVLYALLIAGPDDALQIIQASLASFTVLRRWQAMASMLMIDPMRTGDVLAIAPLRGWVYSHLKRDLFGELEVRFRIACSGWLDTLPALFRSHDFQTGTHLVIDVMRTLPYADACVFRDRILQGVERYPGPPVGEAVARVLEAFPP